jgi:hypothetical protein
MIRIILVIALVILLLMVTCAIFNKHFKSRWFCDHMGWHLAPKKTGFDGASFFGSCPRCNKFVMQDGQGNWF